MAITLGDLKAKVRERHYWARLQLCKAEKEELTLESEAWVGYINALNWVHDFLLDSDVQSAARSGTLEVID